jgi:hypothetical protein
LLVVAIRKARRLTRAALDRDLEAASREPFDGFGNERDAPFAGSRLARNPDLPSQATLKPRPEAAVTQPAQRRRPRMRGSSIRSPRGGGRANLNSGGRQLNKGTEREPQ